MRQMHRKQYRRKQVDQNDINRLESVLIDIVSDTEAGPWREKAQAIRAGMTEEGRSALDEFVAWFPDLED
jgi:ribosomal 50S subunit-associated protein YjgA (DUF615 family)